MYTRNYRDVLVGAALCGFGIFIWYYSISTYNLGSPTQIGTGAVPAALGAILAALGAGIAIPAMLRPGGPVSIQVKPALASLCAVAAFAATINSFGMIPAISTLVIISSLADPKLNWPRVLALVTGLNVLGVTIFGLVLNMPIPLFRWPF